MKLRVRWREECVYERVVEIDDEEWQEANEQGEDWKAMYVDELITNTVIDQADYTADLDSCDDREILDHWKEEE